MAKRRSYVNVGGGGHPRANWWKQTLGTDYYGNSGGSEALPQATAPSPLIANSLDTTTANVSWNDTGADNYILQRATQSDYSDASQVYSGALLTFADSGLTMGAMYYYRVKAQVTGESDSEWVNDSVQTISFMPDVWFEATGAEYLNSNQYADIDGLAGYYIKRFKSIINTSVPTATFPGPTATDLAAIQSADASFGYTIGFNNASEAVLSTPLSYPGDFTLVFVVKLMAAPANGRVCSNSDVTKVIRLTNVSSVLIINSGTNTSINFPSPLVVGKYHTIVIQRVSGIFRVSNDGGNTWGTAGTANNPTLDITHVFGASDGTSNNYWMQRLVISSDILTSNQINEIENYLRRPDYTATTSEAPTDIVLPDGVTWTAMPANNTITGGEIENATTGSHIRDRVLVKGKYAGVLYHEREDLYMPDKFLVWDTEANQYAIAYTFPILDNSPINEVHDSGDIFEYDGRWWHIEQVHYGSYQTTPISIRGSNKGYNLFEFNLIPNAKGVSQDFGTLNNYHHVNQVGDAVLMYTQEQDPGGWSPYINCWKSTDGLNYWEKNRIASATNGAAHNWFYQYTPKNGTNSFSVVFLNYLDFGLTEYPYCFALKTTDGYTFTNLTGSFSKDIRNGNYITVAELIANCVFVQQSVAGKNAYVTAAIMRTDGVVAGICANGNDDGYDWFTIATDGTVTKRAMDLNGRTIMFNPGTFILADQSLVYWEGNDGSLHALVYGTNGGLWQIEHFKSTDGGLTTTWEGVISNDVTKKFHRIVVNKASPYDDYVAVAATIVESSTVGSLWFKRFNK